MKTRKEGFGKCFGKPGGAVTAKKFQSERRSEVSRQTTSSPFRDEILPISNVTGRNSPQLSCKSFFFFFEEALLFVRICLRAYLPETNV